MKLPWLGDLVRCAIEYGKQLHKADLMLLIAC